MLQNMKRLSCLVTVLICLLAFGSAAALEDGDGQVFALVLDGEVTPAMASYVQAAVSDAHTAQATGLLIEISTLGGRLDAALQVRDTLLQTPLPVVIWVRDRASSAGALIALASDTLIMAPGSHIGSAKPIPDDPKTIAFVRGEFKATAEKTGRDPRVAEAMVDETVDLPGWTTAGQILDLTAQEAVETGLAAAVLGSQQAVLTHMGWQAAALQPVSLGLLGKLAQFLTRFEVSALLLSLGIMALIAEWFTPGFGVAGVSGLVLLALYVASGLLAGNAHLWAATFFLVGLVFLIVELFVPGFGFWGITGGLLVAIGVVFSAPTVSQGLFALSLALLAGSLTLVALLRFFGRSRWTRRLVLTQAQSREAGYQLARPGSLDGLVGRSGHCLTPMRPAGTIEVDGRRFDAISQGDYLPAGQKIRVLTASGLRVVVTAHKEEHKTHDM